MGRRPILRQQGSSGTVEEKWLETICLQGMGGAVISVSSRIGLSLTLTSGMSSLAFSRLGRDFTGGSLASCKDSTNDIGRNEAIAVYSSHRRRAKQQNPFPHIPDRLDKRQPQGRFCSTTRRTASRRFSREHRAHGKNVG